MISVLDDGLFNVVSIDGSRRKVGLREVLVNAHKYSDLCGRTSTGRLALLRLCVAFLEDIYRPKTIEDRMDLLESCRFSKDRIEAYCADCEAGGPVFYLDDQKRPFMQMPYDAVLDERAEKPAAAIFMDVPSGNAHAHTDHRRMEEVIADASEALEGLLETYLFCTAGTQGPSSVNNTPPMYCVLRGRTLFETLVLNMVAADELANNIPFGEGCVPWRREMVIQPKESVPVISFLEALTWQPRRITLTFDEDHLVHRVYLQAGRNFVGDERWRDPWVPYQKRKDGSDGSIKPRPGRQLWRDAGNILLAKKNGSIEPVPIANAEYVWRDIPNGILPIEGIGLITDQASVLGLTHEVLRIPEVLVQDDLRVGWFGKWIEMAEEMYSVSTKIIATEYSQTVARFVGEHFLGQMRNEIFGASLERLIAVTDAEEMTEAQRAFGDALLRALRDSLRDKLENSGSSVTNMKRQNAAEGKTMGYCIRRLKEEGMR